MDTKGLCRAVRLAEEVGYVLVATANKQGGPHVAAAGKMESVGDDRVAVSEWFCPGTVGNLTENRGISLVAWDKVADKGYQLLGNVEDVQDVAVLDGYAVGLEPETIPQVQRKLVVMVESVLVFRRGPHSDLEEGSDDKA